MAKSQNTSKTNPFSKEQLEVLEKMLQQTLQSTFVPMGTGSLALKGNSSHTLSVLRENSKSWIVDSGTTNYMIGDLSLFNNYNPCHGNYTARIDDGSLSRVKGTGSVMIFEKVNLESVLYVPNLNYNLLLVSKFTKE